VRQLAVDLSVLETVLLLRQADHSQERAPENVKRQDKQ
jgi:hypothetical protein